MPNNNIFQKIFQPSARGKIWWIIVAVLILLISGSLVDFGSYYNRGSDWLSGKTGGSVVLPKVKEVPFRLGLDLLGGTHLVYQADVSAIEGADKASAVEGVRDVIERRVNTFGVSEPNVQTDFSGGEYKVIVELAGIKDVNQAIKMIGETPLLEFKEQGAEQRDLTEEEKTNLDKTNKAAEAKAQDVLGKAISGGDFGALAKEFSQDDATKDNGGDLGWITESDNKKVVDFAKKLKAGQVGNELLKSDNGYEIVKLIEKRQKVDPFTNEPEKEVEAAHLLICYKGATGCTSEVSKEEAYEKIKQLKNEATPQNFSELVKKNSTEPGADISGGELGWFGRGKMVQPFEDAVFPQKTNTISFVVETEFGYHLIYKKGERTSTETEYHIAHILFSTISAADITGQQSEWKNTELSGKNLKRASVAFDPNDNSPQVSLEFDDAGAQMFEDITSRNVGKPVAIFLDGSAISTPTVNEKISGGKAVITGKFNINDSKLLAQRLNSGALPVPIKLVNQQTIGASLGKDSLNASLKAGIVGLLLVVLFMLGVYRLPGFLASISLLVYGVLVLSVFKLWPVTLTLSGMAGFIMSIGVAVDANVLIFARLKEELANGKVLSLAIDEAFRRAWPSIRDGNFSILITCFILMQFTTSVVKGFAVTLALGVLVSMFSAIVITKNLLKLVAGPWLENKAWLVGKPSSREGENK